MLEVFPSAHTTHAVFPLLLWYFPDAQAVQTLPAPYLPLGQEAQTVLPVVDAYFPSGHFVQALLSLAAA